MNRGWTVGLVAAVGLEDGTPSLDRTAWPWPHILDLRPTTLYLVPEGPQLDFHNRSPSLRSSEEARNRKVGPAYIDLRRWTLIPSEDIPLVDDGPGHPRVKAHLKVHPGGCLLGALRD